MTGTHRVVVTGVGQITPLGFDEGALRARLFSGESAVRRLDGLDAASFRSQNAAQIDSQALSAALSARAWRPGERTTDLAQLAAAQALEEAGLFPAGPGSPCEDTAVLFG